MAHLAELFNKPEEAELLQFASSGANNYQTQNNPLNRAPSNDTTIRRGRSLSGAENQLRVAVSNDKGNDEVWAKKPTQNDHDPIGDYHFEAIHSMFPPVRISDSSKPVNLNTTKVGEMEILEGDKSTRMSDKSYKYEHTVFGSFKAQMAEEAKKISRRVKISELKSKPSFVERINTQFACDLLIGKNTQIYVFIIIIGILAVANNICVDYAVLYLKFGNQYFLKLIEPLKNFNIYYGYLLWYGYIQIGVLFSIIVTNLISINAIGSGIPEMKCVLSGVKLENYLSKRTFISKVLGFTLAQGSYLMTGKEGPFVHMTCIMTNQLSKLPCFERIRNSHSTLQMMLAAAVAVSVAANFGTPVGAMLFSIEVTSTYYPVRNYWFSAFGSFFAGQLMVFISNYLKGRPVLTARIPTNFTTGDITPYVIVLAILVGLSCGITGCLFVRLHMAHIKARRLLAKISFLFQDKWAYSIFISASTAACTYPLFIGPFVSLGLEKVLYNLFTVIDLNINWTTGLGLIPNLSIYFVSIYTLTILSTSLPIPFGLFMPALALGSVLGRIIGELGVELEPSLESDIPLLTAVIGAAAFGASVTHTFSTAVIIFEITGQLSLLFPVLVGTFISLFIAKQFADSIYDSIIKARKLDYLNDLPLMNDVITAEQIMAKVSATEPNGSSVSDSDYPVLTINEKINVVQALLNSIPISDEFYSIPVVKDRGSFFFFLLLFFKLCLSKRPPSPFFLFGK